jgi:hypothetical protein
MTPDDWSSAASVRSRQISCCKRPYDGRKNTRDPFFTSPNRAGAGRSAGQSASATALCKRSTLATGAAAALAAATGGGADRVVAMSPAKERKKESHGSDTATAAQQQRQTARENEKQNTWAENLVAAANRATQRLARRIAAMRTHQRLPRQWSTQARVRAPQITA